MPLVTPDIIDRYQVLKSIGEGGMGALYLARDPAIDRLVAIKLLRENNAELRQRFAAEARSAGRLHHPNIVTIFDVGEHGDQPFIAMEYIQGETLGELGKRQAVISLERKLEWMDKLCAGLHYAHRAGIVHRDIKPANIMIDDEGTLKILDFGIARLGASEMTQAGMVIGTLNYMAPEQMMGKSVDTRADQFSVGAVFYELLTYRRAFPGDLTTGVHLKILTGAPEPLATLMPGLDKSIIAIVDRCLEKDPENRYADLAAMRKEVAAVRSRIAAADPGDYTVAIPTPSSGQAPFTPTPTPSSDRKAGRQGELARVRSEQVDVGLKDAEAAFARNDWNATLKACQQVLLLSADNKRAIDLEERAQAALEQEHLKGWVKDAQGELDRGALTAASLLVDRALSLSASSPEAIKVREQIDAVRRDLAEAQERARKLESTLTRAREGLQSGSLDAASSAVDEVLGLEAGNAGALALRREIDAALAARRKAQEKAQEEARAKGVVDQAKQAFAAGQVEAALQMLSSFSPAHELVSRTLSDLQLEAKEIERRKEAERIRQEAERARKDLSRKLEDSSSKLKASDFAGALARVTEVLAKDPRNADALALKKSVETAIENQTRAEAAERQAAEAAARLKREFDEHLAAATKALEAKDFSGAMNRIESAVRIDGRNAAAAKLRTRIGKAIDEAKKAAPVPADDKTIALKAQTGAPTISMEAPATIQAPVQEPPPTIVLPKAPSPKVEPPKVEPPKIEPPKVEPPKVEAPRIEPPRYEPPKIEPPVVPQSKTAPRPAAKGLSMGVLGGIGAVIVVAVVVGVMLLRGPGTPPVVPSTVVLNVTPWAKIESVTNNADQQAVSIGDTVTPCILTLPPGEYHVKASNPSFPGALEFDVTVAAGGAIQEVNQVMPGFVPEQEIDTILNQ